MPVNTFLTTPFFSEFILPFLLVFALVFAVLQRSKILGDGKKQIDIIVSIVIGLIFVAFSKAVGIVIQLVPFLAVSLVIIMIFLILLGAVFPSEEFKIPIGLKVALGIVFGIAVIIAVLYVTGGVDYLADLFKDSSLTLLTSIVSIGLVVGAIAIVGGFGKGNNKEEKK